ncbi:hypothetical protein [Labrys neptuniae]
MRGIDLDNKLGLISTDPVTKAAADRISGRNHCTCLAVRGKSGHPGIPRLHIERQNYSVPGWAATVAVVREKTAERSEIFEPSAHISWDDWMKVITLPAEIGYLKAVRQVRLYGSHLRCIPPEIGRMASLENLDIYTSYSLHWLPYEITRCDSLRESRMSTRALYGNRKTGLPFPRLNGPIESLMPSTCSVCDRSFDGIIPKLHWITLRVGTDEAPLLVHSCSRECTLSLPASPLGHYPGPHLGDISP